MFGPVSGHSETVNCYLMYDTPLGEFELLTKLIEIVMELSVKGQGRPIIN